jgi:hypothetical protein
MHLDAELAWPPGRTDHLPLSGKGSEPGQPPSGDHQQVRLYGLGAARNESVRSLKLNV